MDRRLKKGGSGYILVNYLVDFAEQSRLMRSRGQIGYRSASCFKKGSVVPLNYAVFILR